jgi:carboxyl-terminal processing protease
MKKLLWTLCSIGVLNACGGGSSSDPPANVSWEQGVFSPADTLAARCEAPRSGTDPDGRPWPDVAGTAAEEKNWLRSWTNELYLWYDEVPDIDPNLSANSVADYFELLKTNDITPSGQPKDKFHFTYPTDEWLALSNSGVIAGYGVQWAILSTTPPREIIVAYIEPGSPAAQAGVERGDIVLTVDGVDIDGNTQADVDVINAGLFPGEINEEHSFVLESQSGGQQTVSLTAEEITTDPVPNVTVFDPQSNGQQVGYILFNDHIATAEAQLIDAIEQLRDADVVDLVLDLRYNGGGFLDIASELAYMIGGSATNGKTFEQLQFSDKHPNTNPVTNQPLDPIPFYSEALGFSATEGEPLPTLNLNRVFVLTGEGTCSASESIINGLRGIGVEVIQIGDTTCGKPYGFYPTDNCGTTYFSIQFRGVNEQNFGDYSDGFSPPGAGGAGNTELEGCAVADDFSHALGDPEESRLAAAFEYREIGNCIGFESANSSARKSAQGKSSDSAIIIPKPLWRQNRILTTPR